MFLRSEAVPALKLYRFYIVQFEEPVSKRNPLFVIAWKATDSGSLGFDFRQPIAGIVIHEHLLKPPSKTKAVYALQPDYSLQQLSLTEREIGDLFSHITGNELRSDERVASLVKQPDFDLMSRKDPGWLDKVCNEQEVFPPNSYWEQKVAPHLKVVEPPKKTRT